MPTYKPGQPYSATVWKGERVLGGLFRVSGQVRVFTPAPNPESPARIEEKVLVYDASRVAIFRGLQVYHHHHNPGVMASDRENILRRAVALEALQQDLLQPTTVDYKQLLREMEIGTSGCHRLPDELLEQW